MFEFIKNVGAAIFSPKKTAQDTVTEVINEPIQQAAKQAATAATDAAVQAAKPKVDELVDYTIASAKKKMVEQIKDLASDAAGTFKSFFKSQSEAATKSINKKTKIVSDIASDKVNESFSDKIKKIARFAFGDDNKAEKTANDFDSKTKSLSNIFQTGIIGFVSGLFKTIVDYISTAINKLFTNIATFTLGIFGLEATVDSVTKATDTADLPKVSNDPVVRDTPATSTKATVTFLADAKRSIATGQDSAESIDADAGSDIDCTDNADNITSERLGI